MVQSPYFSVSSVGEKLVQPRDAIPDLIQQRPFGGTQFGPTDGNYTAETPEIRRRYREMLRCGWVKVAVFSKLWDVSSLTFGMTPDNPDDDREKLIAQANADNINSCRGGIQGVIEAILFGAMVDGYGASHKKWWEPDRGKLKGKRALYELRPKDTDYWYPILDRYRNVAAIQERYPAPGDPNEGRLDLADFVYVTHASIFDNPYGMSDLRAADQAYCCLDAARKLRMIYLDKYIGPFLVGKYTDDNVRAKLAMHLQEGRAGGWITIPQESDVEVISLAMGNAEAFSKAEADFKEEIVTSVAFAFLQHMAGQVPGGAGRTSEHAQTAKLPRWYLTRLACRAIDDQIVPDFTDSNFAGSPAYPKSTLEGTDPAAVLADLEIAALKLDMGGEVSKTELDKRSGWGPAKNDGDRLVKLQSLDPFGNLDKQLNPPAKVPVKPGANGAAE